MAQFDITVSYAITQCFEPNLDGTPTSNPDVRFAIEVEAKPRSVIGETFSIDPEALAAPTKITALTVQTFETGTLRSVNASAEDRTGPIVASIVRAAIGGVGIATGIPVGAVSAEQTRQGQTTFLVCAAGTQDRLKAIDTASDAVGSARSALKATTDRVMFLTEQATAGRLVDRTRSELVEKLALQALQSTALVRAQANLEAAKGRVSEKMTLRWPTQFDGELNTATPLPTEEALLDFAALLDLRAGLPAGKSCGTVQMLGTTRALINERRAAIAECLKTEEFPAVISLVPVNESASEVTTPATNDGAAADAEATPPAGYVDAASEQPGIFYRPPGRGRLIACQTDQLGCGNNPAGLLWASDDLWIPQFGQLRLLPFRNGPFENNALTLLLRADGTAEKVEYADKSASAEGLADSVEDAILQAQTLASALRADSADERIQARQQRADQQAADLAAIQHNISVTTLSAQLAALQNAQSPSDLQLVRAQTEMANARLALAQAQLAERAALAALAAQP